MIMFLNTTVLPSRTWGEGEVLIIIYIPPISVKYLNVAEGGGGLDLFINQT